MPLQVPIEIEIEIEIRGNNKLLHEAQQATCLFLCLERKMDHIHYFLRLCIKLACMTSTITNDFCSEISCHFFIQKNWGKITVDWIVLFLSSKDDLLLVWFFMANFHYLQKHLRENWKILFSEC
jgi:hypothetical protein